MKCKFNAVDINSIQYKMEISMSLGDWRLIQDGLNKNYPQTQLSIKISDMVNQVYQTIYPTDGE